MSQLGTVYATKRRRRNGKSLKPPPKDGVTKSNPSKRHRERLNAELDLLASLLPFEQNILSKLDRLSILRLSVSYLRTKSYFQAVMHKDKDENGVLTSQQQQQHHQHPHHHNHDGYASSRLRELEAIEHSMLEGDMFLQALNGFLMILSCDGEVFFATHSIESYLGFHQSDIVHQSVYELVHSEDREELQRQLLWNSFLPGDCAAMSLAETLAADRAHLLERSFTVRFRCLLDNTSGFLRLDIRGRVKVMQGQNRKCEEPPLGLFAYCTPFGPPSLLEIPQKENMFKSKHKLDFSLVSMDQRGKSILGFSDAELASMGGYDLVHFDDLAYVASAHQELLKTGASGMIAYRYQKKDNEWQWLQTSSRLVYKNSKPDFVICTHRQLMEEEGRDLLGKRTMDFKVSYLDTGLASTYFSESDQLVAAPSGSPNSLPPPTTPHKPTRRYKTQLRDFLSTCRSKRKLQQQQSSMGQVTPPAPVVDYIPDPAAAVAAAYSNLNPMYSTSPYAPGADNIYMTPAVHHSSNFYPTVTDNLFHQYRLQGVGGYYPEYHHSASSAAAATYAVTNGFLPYDSYSLPPSSVASSKEEKWAQSSATPDGGSGKYYATATTSGHHLHDGGVRVAAAYAGYASPATPTAAGHHQLVASGVTSGALPATTAQIIQSTMKSPKPSPSSSAAAAAAVSTAAVVAGTVAIAPADTVSCSSDNPSPTAAIVTVATNRTTTAMQRGGSLKAEHASPVGVVEPFERQTVLMWGSTSNSNASSSNRSPNSTPTSNGPYGVPGATGAHQQPQQQQQQQQPLADVSSVSADNKVHMTIAQSPLSTSPADCSGGGEHQVPLKWNGGSHSQKHKGAVQVYQITHLPTGSTPTTTSSDPLYHGQSNHQQHHQQHHHQQQPQQHDGVDSSESSAANQPSIVHHGHHQAATIGGSCEVWSPSYSQYQYFTYHHAPQHASTQSSLADTSVMATISATTRSHNGLAYTRPPDTLPYRQHPGMHQHHHQAATSQHHHHLQQQQQQQQQHHLHHHHHATSSSSPPATNSVHHYPHPPHHHHHHQHRHHHHHPHPGQAHRERSPLTRTGVLCCPSLR